MLWEAEQQPSQPVFDIQKPDNTKKGKKWLNSKTNMKKQKSKSFIITIRCIQKVKKTPYMFPIFVGINHFYKKSMVRQVFKVLRRWDSRDTRLKQQHPSVPAIMHK